MHFQKQSPDEVGSKKYTSSIAFWAFYFIIFSSAIALFFLNEKTVGFLILLATAVIFPPLDNYLKNNFPYLRIPDDAKAYTIYIILIGGSAIIYHEHFALHPTIKELGASQVITATSTPKLTKPCLKSSKGYCLRR